MNRSRKPPRPRDTGRASSNPLVTVVVPAYNEAKYIRKCVDSLLSQSYSPLEIIAVDDGSSDGTLQVLRQYEAKHNNFRLITQQHEGPGAARNKAARAAKGKILVLIDADMYFDKNYVRELVAPIIAGKAVGTYHWGERIGNPGNIFARFKGTPHTVESEKDFHGVFRAILKDAFLKVGGFDNSADYFDDGTLSSKSRLAPVKVASAICYHNNAETLSEVFKDYRWRGRSAVKSPLLAKKYAFAGGLFFGGLISQLIIIIYAPLFALGLYLLSILAVGLAGAIRFGDLRALYSYAPYLGAKYYGFFSGTLTGLYSSRKGK